MDFYLRYAGLHVALFFPVNSVQMLKLFIKGPKASETQHRTQFDHDTNVGMVTFGLGGHLEAKIVSKKFA